MSDERQIERLTIALERIWRCNESAAEMKRIAGVALGRTRLSRPLPLAAEMPTGDPDGKS